jgi:hypothetical protein
MRDAQGVFFNARRGTQGIGESPVLSILTSTERSEQFEVKSFDDLVSALVQNKVNIDFGPVVKSLRTDPETLHDPKSRIWPVRDQGTSRGTCVPFAALASLELQELRKGGLSKDIDYSEEFIYAKSRKELASLGPHSEPEKDTTGATFLVQSAKALIDFGVPLEESLPYNYVRGDPDWTAKVSGAVSDEAKGNKLDESSVFVTLDFPPRPEVEHELSAPFPTGFVVDFIQACLSNGAAVSITLPVYPTANNSPWTVGNAWKTGVIPDPTDAVKKAGSDKIGHAVCIIGMVPNPSAAEGEANGWFIFRNSWGTRFGYARPQNPVLDKVLAPGYGAISFAHVENECWGMMALLRSG